MDPDELDQRIEDALNARTYGELDRLIKDLPQSATAAGWRAGARRSLRRASPSRTATPTSAGPGWCRGS
ncbi:DUF1707 domain-containing protein [Catenulispora yoronensis]